MEEIKECPAEEFPRIVKERTEEKAFEYLSKLKENQSKIKNLKYKKLELQMYLKSNQNLTNSQVNFTLSAKSRGLNLRDNFKSTQETLVCRICEDINSVESQPHLLDCAGINVNIKQTTKTYSLKIQISLSRHQMLSGQPIKGFKNCLKNRPSACGDSTRAAETEADTLPGTRDPILPSHSRCYISDPE